MIVPESPRLSAFVDALGSVLDDGAKAEQDILDQVVRAMRDLVATDDWLDPGFAVADPEHYQQYLLFRDPDSRFSVVSFVWAPGQRTPIHDHTVWGVVGMLRGSEISQPFRLSNGRMVADREEQLDPGDVIALSPEKGDIHRVRNALADGISISIHAYGGDIGTIRRHIFSEKGEMRCFVSSYSTPRSSGSGTGSSRA